MLADDMSTAVVLPCSTKDFGKFISSILGKPQTISNTVRGPFEISRDDVSSVHALLVQRVAQQNEAVLSQFTAKLVFSDDSSVLLNSIDDFLTYNEVRPISCMALHLSWTFLVKFNDRSYPEKQQIDLSFLGGAGPPIIDRDMPVVMFGESDTGFIAYRVSHTARTWGSDIDSLLSSHLKGVVDEIPKLRKWLAKNDVKIALLAFCALFFSSIIATFLTTASFVAKQKGIVSGFQLFGSSSTVSNKQMIFLLDTVASGVWERFLLMSGAFLLLSFVLSIGVAVWIGMTADNLPPSFLLLTKESEKRKKKILSKRRNKWLSFIISLIVGILIGICGNISYAMFFEKLIIP